MHDESKDRAEEPEIPLELISGLSSQQVSFSSGIKPEVRQILQYLGYQVDAASMSYIDALLDDKGVEAACELDSQTRAMLAEFGISIAVSVSDKAYLSPEVLALISERNSADVSFSTGVKEPILTYLLSAKKARGVPNIDPVLSKISDSDIITVSSTGESSTLPREPQDTGSVSPVSSVGDFGRESAFRATPPIRTPYSQIRRDSIPSSTSESPLITESFATSGNTFMVDGTTSRAGSVTRKDTELPKINPRKHITNAVPAPMGGAITTLVPRAWITANFPLPMPRFLPIIPTIPMANVKGAKRQRARAHLQLPPLLETEVQLGNDEEELEEPIVVPSEPKKELTKELSTEEEAKTPIISTPITLLTAAHPYEKDNFGGGEPNIDDKLVPVRMSRR
jgi:hypothetical protein